MQRQKRHAHIQLYVVKVVFQYFFTSTKTTFEAIFLTNIFSILNKFFFRHLINVNSLSMFSNLFVLLCQ